MNMEQEVIKAATGVATTAANKGIGKLTDLVFSKQIRQQRRLDHLSSVQDQKDAELIQQGLAEFRDGGFILIEEQIGNPASPLGLILAQNNQNQSENLSKCLSKAYEHLSEKNDDEINDEQISETFFNKWMNYGKEVSEEELQDLWGKILSEEITTPNSLNYLVLHSLSLMSKNQLEKFSELLNFVFKSIVVANHKGGLDISIALPQITQNELDELVDFNLINSLSIADSVYYKLDFFTFNSKKYQAIWNNQGNYILGIQNDIQLDIYGFRLTTIGKKLMSLSNQTKSESANAVSFAKYLLTLDSLKDIDHIDLFLNNNQLTFVQSIYK
ncbi:hypothetical protein B9T26_04895 [Acinetobacter sp. ANC 4169]|uniref:DUF2806 domain-containing protein n=1 Tax=Acinetobacter sp. ANC 4169 TaxID=1977879 RepID=UPI000A34E34C|nr:DUF2806 domain-containing protein [Acinetobacter sp. ANC 4169]OTG75834.1 hypothetical protein B9T26_04895 [Acinetobacter sp. ANC 4169]